VEDVGAILAQGEGALRAADDLDDDIAAVPPEAAHLAKIELIAYAADERQRRASGSGRVSSL
jgi:hypothetical protein